MMKLATEEAIYQQPDIRVCRLIGWFALEYLRMHVRDDHYMSMMSS